jgi:hypothetical protein
MFICTFIYTAFLIIFKSQAQLKEIPERILNFEIYVNVFLTDLPIYTFFTVVLHPSESSHV